MKKRTYCSIYDFLIEKSGSMSMRKYDMSTDIFFNKDNKIRKVLKVSLENFVSSTLLIENSTVYTTRTVNKKFTLLMTDRYNVHEKNKEFIGVKIFFEKDKYTSLSKDEFKQYLEKCCN